MAKRGWTRRGALGATLASSAAAACGSRAQAPRYEGALSFSHGVASGDPGIDRVVIWTRVTPEQNGPVPVRWVVARDRNLNNIVQQGVVETSDLRDYTVKVNVTGLRPGAPYFYGFLAGDQRSPVGKTKTLPQGRLDHLNLAVTSCASFPHGFFNVYDAIAQNHDVDLVIHLGDYIYEYGVGGFGGDVGVGLGRIPQPEIECVSLADYRQRHAQYKTEAELQAAHEAHPWIVVWDDHETANDSWSGGAENHQPNEGLWATRKRAALQAYYEWMPIRDPEPGQAFEAINRVFQFGDLMTLCMLETRLLARTKQVDFNTEMPLYSTPWDFSNPQAPRPVSPAEHYPASVRLIPVPYEVIGDRLVAIWEWPRVQAAVAAIASPPANIRFVPDRAKLRQLLDQPDRALLGTAQEQWLAQQLNASHRSGVTWQVLGNQVLVAQTLAPDLSNIPAATVASLERLQPGVGRLLFFTRFGLPISTDQWDGYPAQRQRLLDILHNSAGNTIILTGDSHAAWANELLDRGGARVAVEFGATSVTSPGFGALFAGSGVDLDQAIVAANDDVKWTDQSKHGYTLLKLTKDLARADFITVSTIASKQFDIATEASFTVRPDELPGIGAITPVQPGPAQRG